MCSLHYGFVWISEPMAGTLFDSFNYVWKLCYQRITRIMYGIYSDQKYKKH